MLLNNFWSHELDFDFDLLSFLLVFFAALCLVGLLTRNLVAMASSYYWCPSSSFYAGCP